MKIHQDKEEFKPITITFQTEYEYYGLRRMMHLMNEDICAETRGYGKNHQYHDFLEELKEIIDKVLD
jgi:hypothetical protein